MLNVSKILREKCKQCSVQGKSVDVVGTEDGLVLHLQDEHNLRGDWLCENCHHLSQSEKCLENHLLLNANEVKGFLKLWLLPLKMNRMGISFQFAYSVGLLFTQVLLVYHFIRCFSLKNKT